MKKPILILAASVAALAAAGAQAAQHGQEQTGMM